MKKMKIFDNFGIMLPVANKASMSIESVKNFSELSVKWDIIRSFFIPRTKWRFSTSLIMNI